MGLELACLSEGDDLPKALPLPSQNGFEKLGILHIQGSLLSSKCSCLPCPALAQNTVDHGVNGILIAWLLCMLFI